jgi:Anti-sigma-K factor rskA
VAHTDPDVLALLALGESTGTPADLEHVARCADCARALDEFALVAAAGRAGDPSDALMQPSDRVWAGISASLGLSPDLAPELPRGQSVRPAGALAWPAGTPAPDGAAAPEASAVPGSAPVEPLAPRRAARNRRTTWLAVAAGFVVVGGVATALVIGSLAGGQADVVAEADLDALPDWPDAGGSAIVREADGERILDVTVSPDSRPDSVREVWLISSDLSKLVSVGLLAADEGRFPLPQDIDLEEYSVVDVSSEPLDGNPAHSSDSIVRGALRSA